MLCKVLLLVFHLSPIVSSSFVVDNAGQKSIFVTDYCPKMKFCPEGAHVMCMYYNSKSKMGPRCSNPKNISMTPDLANKLVDVTNAIRSRIAQGKEKGNNGELLPRGYGIFRLHWDNELATFAQVLVNQCVLRHDLCRATARFPDPGQTAGLVRFSYPDWFPVSKSSNFTTPGLSADKLRYATTQVLKSWYGQKNAVTPSMMTYYPDWTKETSLSGRLYLEMIYGSATHMGCGISAYTEYAFYDNNAALNYNSVQIICNYSGRPRQGTAVYNTVPPSDTAIPFNLGGCPEGSEADDDFLCKEIDRKPMEPHLDLKENNRQCPDGEVCDPAVVVLPIFTVEDAPPEKLISHESYTNSSRRSTANGGFFQMLLNERRNSNERNQIVNKSQAKSDSKGNASEKKLRIKPPVRKSRRQQVTIKNRYFDNKQMDSKRIRHAKKTSLFSQAVKFELPEFQTRKVFSNQNTHKKTAIKDVVPRKDFTNAKQLVKKYLFRNNNLEKIQDKSKIVSEIKPFKKDDDPLIHEIKDTPVELEALIGSLLKENHLTEPLYKDTTREETSRTKQNYEPLKSEKYNTFIEHKTFNNKRHLNKKNNILKTTEPKKVGNEIVKYKQIPTLDTELYTAENNLIIQNTFLKDDESNSNYLNQKVNNINKESDNKLMAILDTLEQEVKHVELRDKDKQVFDEKIRKIYGKVVGKSVGLLDFNIKYPTDTLLNKTQRIDDAQDSNFFQKSIQQEDNLDWRSISMINNMNTTYTPLHRKSNLRGIKPRDLSHEHIQKTYFDFENDRNLDDRKAFRKKEFNRNNLGDMNEFIPRRTENQYQDINNEIHNYRDDKTEKRSINRDLEYRRNKMKYHHRKDDIERRLRNKNYYIGKNNDYLSNERRRFYQEKLDDIERKLQLNNYKRRKSSQHMRPMKPDTRKSENQMDLYGRARFAHGY